MAGLAHLQAGRNGKVSVDIREEVAILTYDCEENRFNSLFVDRVNSALDIVLSHPNVKVLLTTGAGRFYSNGLDLAWMDPLRNDETEFHKFAKKTNNLSARMLTFPIPTVAVINGHCYAQGAFWSLCHDYRVMQTGRGWWCLNEVHIGIFPNEPSLAVIKCKIAGQQLHEALTLGKKYTAEQALDAGIVQRISSPEDLVESACRCATESLPKNGYNRDYLGGSKENNFQEVLKMLRTSGLEIYKSKL